MSEKMIQHIEYDRKTGKKIVTMIPQPEWHKERTAAINKAISKYKPPTAEERKKEEDSFYNYHLKKFSKRRHLRAYND